jgi:hypothetical protein
MAWRAGGTECLEVPACATLSAVCQGSCRGSWRWPQAISIALCSPLPTVQINTKGAFQQALAAGLLPPIQP